MSTSVRFLPLLFLFYILLGAPFPNQYGTRASAQGQTLNQTAAVEFDVAAPGGSGVNLENFRYNQRIDSVYGLRADEYTTSIKGTSTATVRGENIGQVIVYARLVNTAANSIFIDNPDLKGHLTFTPVVAGREVEDMKANYSFSASDEYRQIYYLTQMAEVEAVIIKLTTSGGVFLLERLKMIPYSDYGIATIRNRERYDSRILSVPQRRQQLYDDYLAELMRVEEYHEVLSELVARKESADLAALKTQGYNPFAAPAFQAYFNQLLAKASEQEMQRVRTVRADIAKFNFRDIALSVDNLLLGGKFATLVNLAGDIFQNNITLNDHRGRPMRVVQLNNTDYAADDRGNKLVLKPLKEVVDPDKLREVQGMKIENEQYQQYVSTLQQFLGEDLETQNKINQDMEVAGSLRDELERLLWEILEGYTERPRADFIESNDIIYTLVTSEFTNHFPQPDEVSLDFLDRQELKLQISRNNLRDIRTRYQELLGNLQTHYSTLYLKTPQKRVPAFQDLNRLPSTISATWAGNQLEIATAYQDSALKALLDRALTAL